MPKSKPSPNSVSENSLSEIGQRILHYIQAGYPALYLVSPEEQRIEAELKAVIQHLDKYALCFWSVVDGLVNSSTKEVVNAQDPLEVLQAVQDMKEKGVVFLRDYHLHLQDPNPILVRKLKDVLYDAKTKQKCLVIVGCRLFLPPELEREIVVVEYDLPKKPELDVVLAGILESANIQISDRDAILDAASGLTTMEAENAFALSYVQSKTILPKLVASEKAQAVKKNGLLEIIEPTENLNSIGGLDVLKTWLLKRKQAFAPKAQEYGLPAPKGLLILGIAGTGKSLSAKATSAVFNVPLLKLDAGKIFASLVGQSESNLRSVIQTAEAIAPCVLWIDELEKGFSGSKSSGSTDGGTSARVFGSFISWMQEKKSAVFVVATANDVSQLPPELLRKGRWDELFFVDLPNESEREAIWKIQIQKYGRDETEFDTQQLAKITEGLTGSEIEAVFVEALYAAFEKDREPTDLTIASVLNDFVPLSRLMKEQIEGLRKWSSGRARAATTCAEERKLRRL